jgi:hypothetical protein
MSPREPQRTPPKTLAVQSSRDMLEKLRREIDRLTGSIIRQDIVDNGLNAAIDLQAEAVQDSPNGATRLETPTRGRGPGWRCVTSEPDNPRRRYDPIGRARG